MKGSSLQFGIIREGQCLNRRHANVLWITHANGTREGQTLFGKCNPARESLARDLSAQAIARGKSEGNAAVKSKVTVLDTKALRQPDRRTLGTGVGRKARTNHNPTSHIFL